MRFQRSNLLGLASLVPAAHAYAYAYPEPTQPLLYPEVRAPEPTPAPDAELVRRAREADQNTCGWVSGDTSSALTCPVWSGTTPGCAKYTPSGYTGMAGCCYENDYQSCIWATKCMGLAEVSSSCDRDCLANTFIMKCTSVSLPFCMTWTYGLDVIQQFGCTDQYGQYSTPVPVELSAGNLYVSELFAPQDAVTGWQNTTTSTSRANPTAATGAAQTTASSNGGGGGSDFPIGAVVGGAVGGAAFLAIVAGLLIWICLRKRKNKQQQTQQQPPPGPPQQPQTTQYAPVPQASPMMQQGQPVMPVYNELPANQAQGGYFHPNAGYYNQDAKDPNAQAYGLSTPGSPPGAPPGAEMNYYSAASTPGSPQPQYVQPYGPPGQEGQHQPYVQPQEGTGNGPVPPQGHLPGVLRVNSPPQGQPPHQQQQPRVYEMGGY